MSEGTTTVKCPSCGKSAITRTEDGQVPDGAPWNCKHCNDHGNVDAFPVDGTYVAVSFNSPAKQGPDVNQDAPS